MDMESLCLEPKSIINNKKEKKKKEIEGKNILRTRQRL